MSYRHAGSKTGISCLGIQKAAYRMEAAVLDQVRQLAETPGLREAAMVAARQELATKRGPCAAEQQDLLRALAGGGSAFDK